MSSVLTRHLSGCFILLVTLASLVDAASAQTAAGRSVGDTRARIPDELDRPRYRERWTHRGWQLRTNVFDVVANTTAADARWAVAEAERAWADTAKMADHWTTAHRRPDFALGMVQIFLDGEPAKNRDQPSTTLDVVGLQTQIHLHLSPGNPPFEEQLPRLRQAAVMAFLHTTEIDRQLPAWVCWGLADYVANQGTPLHLHKPQANEKVPLGGRQWRGTRAAADRLATAAGNEAADNAEAAARVKFLLEGNDGAHTFHFFQAIQGMLAGSTGQRDPLAELVQNTDNEFAVWQNDPHIGQPQFVPDTADNPDSIELKRRMLLVLKLLRRFPAAEQRAITVKITGFPNEVADSTDLSEESTKLPTALEDLCSRITAPSAAPWATLDPQGKLLLSTETHRLRELLGLDRAQFAVERRGDRFIVSAKAKGGKLHGWMDENAEDARRPIVKFHLEANWKAEASRSSKEQFESQAGPRGAQ